MPRQPISLGAGPQVIEVSFKFPRNTDVIRLLGYDPSNPANAYQNYNLIAPKTGLLISAKSAMERADDLELSEEARRQCKSLLGECSKEKK